MAIDNLKYEFKQGKLYQVDNYLVVCSSSGTCFTGKFRSFPDCKVFRKHLAFVQNTNITLLASNVPYRRKTKKGILRVKTWVVNHPEIFI